MRIIVFLSLFLCNAFLVRSQSWDEVAKTFPFPFQRFLTSLEFGSSVDIDSNYAVIGITNLFTNYKQVSVLKKDANNWQKVATLLPPDSTGFNFGAHVAIDNDVIVVGFPNYSSFEGRAYVYEKPVGGWVDTIPTAELSPSNGVFDEFGSSVAISNNTIVVGQLSYSVGVAGKILVYEKPVGGWVDMTENATLTPSSALNLYNITFGNSVAIDSNVIIAGVDNEIFMGQQSGTAYIFEEAFGGWTSGTEVAKIYPSNGSNYDNFGRSVSISKNNIVVGAPLHNSFGSGSGAAYIYTKTGVSWAGTTNETAILNASLMSSLDHFGQSVSIDDSTIVVGAPGTYLYPKRSGAAFVYKQPQGGWANAQEIAYLISYDRYPDDLFGQAVAISSGTVLVGAIGDDDYGPNSGSAYFFSEDSTSWQTTIEDQKVWPDQLLRPHGSSPYFGSSVAIDDRYAVVGMNSTLSASTDMVYVLYYNDTSWISLGTLFPSDPEVGKKFGASVAIEGDLIAVGSPADDTQTNFDVGAIYIYEKPIHGWGTMSQTAKLRPSPAGNFSKLGTSVAISGDVVVGGAPGAVFNQAGHAGAVFLYEKPGVGWFDTTQTAVLAYDQAIGGTELGFSVDIDSNVVIAGAPSNSISPDSTRNITCVFEKPVGGWVDMTQTAILSKNSGFSDEFGHDVAISGNTIVASALDEYTPVSGIGNGLIYLYEKPANGWADATESHVLSHTPDAIGANGFGTSVDIDTDTVVVGSMFHASSSTSGSGAIYIYVKESSEWKDTTETRRYFPVVGTSYQRFGCSIGIDNGRIIVGSNGDSIGSSANNAYPKGTAFLLENCLTIPDTMVLAECNNYVLPSGYVVTNSGIYQDYVDVGYGCDSVTVFDLTITSVDTTVYVAGNDVISAEVNANMYQWLDCDNAFSPIFGANSMIYTPGINQGSYAVELTKNNCIDTTNCFLYLDCYPTYDSLYINSCETYTTPSGTYQLSATGIYFDTLINNDGCDSVLTIFYLNNSLNPTVVLNGIELICNTSSPTYQWIDCDNGFQVIPGAVNQNFTPPTNGSYAVIVENLSCVDTSDCYVVNSISLDENNNSALMISPNPTTNEVLVSCSSKIERIRISDLFGRIIYDENAMSQSVNVDLTGKPEGIYIISVNINNGFEHRAKILKRN
jgi:hypothetical protein